MENIVYTIILLPVLGFLINGCLGKRLPKLFVGGFATLIVFVSFILSVYLFLNFEGLMICKAFQWFRISGVEVNFAFQIDQLSLIMMMVITGIGTLIHLYSIGYMSNDQGFYKFFTYLNLFIFSMLLLVMGSNYLILFIGWEGVGVCSYLLIGFWYQNKEYGKAARKAFIMNRIGDLGLLTGIFMLMYQTNSIDYLSVFQNASAFSTNSYVIVFITISLFIGAVGKSAQLPLFTWLPDAMAGPTPVSALIHAATMVTAGIYLIVRSNLLYSLAPLTLDIILYVAILTALVAAFIALRQNDIKKVLAYSTVSQLGFMFVALGLGVYTTAMFHLLTHAFFKALLFLGSGSVIHAMGGEQDMRFMGGLKKKIPVTHVTFLIGTLAISGMPLFSGMISKDEILVHLFEKNPLLWGVLFLIAAMTATYMFRLYYLTFSGTFRGTKEQEAHLHESPVNMTLPLVILAILSVFGGFLNLPYFLGDGKYEFLAHWLEPIYYKKKMVEELDFSTEMILLSVTILMFFVVWILIKNLYSNKGKLAKEKYQGWEKYSAGKLYLDEIYNSVVVNPIIGLSKSSLYFDKNILDGLVERIGSCVKNVGRGFKKLQNGNVEFYLFVMSLAVGIILIINFLLQ